MELNTLSIEWKKPVKNQPKKNQPSEIDWVYEMLGWNKEDSETR